MAKPDKEDDRHRALKKPDPSEDGDDNEQLLSELLLLIACDFFRSSHSLGKAVR